MSKNNDPVIDPVLAPRKPKILFFDIETSPNLCWSWGIGPKVRLTYDNIVTERLILTIAYKWLGENKIHALAWENGSDKKMLAVFSEVIAEADILVYHNGDKFDLPNLKTRCLFHGLPPFPECRTMDTLKVARAKFRFNSNKLDYIGQYLGLGQKIKTEFSLWKNVMSPDKDVAAKALNKMVAYNKGDVILLEKVWDKLQNYTKPVVHGAVLNGFPAWACPRTGSLNVKLTKTRVSAAGTVSYQFLSKESGGYYTVSQTVYDQYLADKTKLKLDKIIRRTSVIGG